MQEAVVLLAILHRRYEFVPVPGYTINTKIDGFFQGLEGGLPVVVKRRQ